MEQTGSQTGDDEIVLSSHTAAQWKRRKLELAQWVVRPKPAAALKGTAVFSGTEVDEQLYPALVQLERCKLDTEFSCAGVSMLDNALDHSLYAYITFIASESAERFVQLAMEYMKHRLLVSYEPSKGRYDLSSFYIGHNRSFCMLMTKCARQYDERCHSLQ
ncbi:hypothetical protein EBB07_17315 [Paenibacillaceae bacterium]|nr:hypothetical protein EBB07_17315 [Paenibacillaceae bacterium]